MFTWNGRAFHDELTGLRNRHWILDILDTDLAVASRDGSRLAMLSSTWLVADPMTASAGPTSAPPTSRCTR